ncbi:MAG: hypothetical protein K6G52_08930 [Treponemataceae bacterium]|nr:hypothetical protein [Treponemataceae bacterium]
MNKKFFSIFLLLIIASSIPSFSYYVMYKEQFYKLYHVHYQQYPEDVIENIYWLEKAAKADFCNPQCAMTKIKDKDEWEKYRYLFNMHLNLKLVEQHMRLGRLHDKNVAYFYDAPWKEEYLSELEMAETCYKTGLVYWEEAKLWSEKAGMKKFQFMTLTGIQNWEDEHYRIANHDLDYEKILTRELNRVEKVKSDFQAMDENTY